MTAIYRPDRGPGALLGWVCAGHALSHFWLLTLPPLFPALAGHFGLTFVQLGLILALYSLTYGIFQIPAGYLVDRHGAKPVLVGGLLLHGVAFALYALAPSYALLLVLALVAGIGQSVFHPADYSILSSAFPAEKAGKPYSLHTFCGYAGSAAAPVTVAALYVAFGWQTTLAVTGLVGVVLALLLVPFLKAPGVVPERPAAASSEAAAEAGRRVLLSQALVLMFVFYVFSSMTSSGVQSFVPTSLVELYGMPLGGANAALTVYLAALCAGILLGGVLADRVRNHAAIVGGMFAFGMALMFVLAVAQLPLWLLFPVFAAAGAFHGVVMPSRDKMVRAATPEGSAGKSFGFVSTGLSLGGLLAPPILGYLLDLGLPNLVFWALAAFMLVAVLTTLVPRSEKAR